MSGPITDPADLPEFSGDLACCDACEWPDAKTGYVTAFPTGRNSLGAVAREFLNSGKPRPLCAFLLRVCTRCGFQWAERLIGR